MQFSGEVSLGNISEFIAKFRYIWDNFFSHNKDFSFFRKIIWLNHPIAIEIDKKREKRKWNRRICIVVVNRSPITRSSVFLEVVPSWPRKIPILYKSSYCHFLFSYQFQLLLDDAKNVFVVTELFHSYISKFSYKFQNITIYKFCT